MKPAGGGGGGGKAAGLPPAPAGPASSEKVVHSRSQVLFGSGTKALGDALKLLVPRSTAFMSSDAELWDFLCSLKHEFSPVILRSKDVYGYASCRAVVPELPRGWAAGTRAGPGPSGGRKGGGGAANKGKRPRSDAKSRRAGGAKRAAKKRRQDGLSAAPTAPDQPRPCEGRPDPPRTRLEGDGGASQRAAAAAASFPPVRVRGDIWKRRDLEAARRRAQRLLRVNLAPVVKLRRIAPGPPCC